MNTNKDIFNYSKIARKLLNFTNQISKLKMSNQLLSLYIPRVFSNFSKEYIAGVFEKLRLGKVSNIDFVTKFGNDGQAYNSTYVHFEFWYNTVAVRNFQDRVLDPNQEARIVYDDPWYWIVLENTAKKQVTGQPKPRITLDTPVINRKTTMPSAPQKLAAAARQTVLLPYSRRLEDEFAAEEEEEEERWIDEQIDSTIEGQMNIIEDIIDEEENHLATFDRRYVQALEEENALLHHMVSLVHI